MAQQVINKDNEVLNEPTASSHNLTPLNETFDNYYEQFREDVQTLFAFTGLSSAVLRTLDTEALRSHTIGNIPYHTFKLNAIGSLRFEHLDLRTVTNIYKTLFEKMVRYEDTNFELRFLENLIYRYKDPGLSEKHLLWRLHALMAPSEKARARALARMIEYTVTNRSVRVGPEYHFKRLLDVPKWSKVEFVVCNALYDEFANNAEITEIVLENTFRGFQDTQAVHTAHLLFNKILKEVSDTNPIFYSDILKVAVSLLKGENCQKTLRSSLINYVIPTIAELEKSRLIKHIPSLQPIYRLHMIKYLFSKQYIKDFDVDLVKKTLEENPNLVNIVWKIFNSFPKSDYYITNQHIELFMLCLGKYKTEDPQIPSSIHSFLSQMVISMLEENRREYKEFFKVLERIIDELINGSLHTEELRLRRPIYEIHARVTYLINGSYLALKTRYPIPKRIQYTASENPLQEFQKSYVSQGKEIIKGFILGGVTDERMCETLQLYKTDYDESLNTILLECLKTAFTKPNLDRLQQIKTYTKILIKMYKDNNKEFEFENFVSNIIDIANANVLEFKNSTSWKKQLKFPLYTTGEALLIISDGYKNFDNLEIIFQISLTGISYTLTAIDEFDDYVVKKFYDQLLITLIQLLEICVRNLNYQKSKLKLTLNICEMVMLRSKQRKSTSVAYQAVLNITNKVKGTPNYQSLVDYLLQKFSTYLKAIDGGPMNRCLGSREILLLIFKMLSDDKMTFRKYFNRIIQSETNDHFEALAAICEDSDLKRVTGYYLEPLFKKVVRAMGHESFPKRNAALRLLEVIITRLLGTRSEIGYRPLNALHIFEAYPGIKTFCVTVLKSQENISAKYGVLIFLAACPHQDSVFGVNDEVPHSAVKATFNINHLSMVSAHAIGMTTHPSNLRTEIEKKIDDIRRNYRTISSLEYLVLEILMTRYVGFEENRAMLIRTMGNFNDMMNMIQVDRCVSKPYFRYPYWYHKKRNLFSEDSYKNLTLQAIKDMVGILKTGDNYLRGVALSNIEGNFHHCSLERKITLFEQLMKVFVEDGQGFSVFSYQFSCTLKSFMNQIYKYITKTNPFENMSIRMSNIYVIEFVTALVNINAEYHASFKIDFMKTFKHEFVDVLKKTPRNKLESTTAIVQTLINVIRWPDVKSAYEHADYFYFLFMSLVHVENKSHFSKLFEVLFNGGYSTGFCIHKLPQLVERTLGTSVYNVIKKKVFGYIVDIKREFLIEYTGLHQCPLDPYELELDIHFFNALLGKS